MDTICCARCNVVRQQIYRTSGGFIWSKIGFDYLKSLTEKYPTFSLLSSCIISTCGEKLIHIPVGRSELLVANVLPFIKQQMLMWREMGISSTILKPLIAYARNGLPIIMPGNEAKIVEQTGEEGVVVQGNFLRVVNEEKALLSKWSHVIRCQKVLEILFPGLKVEVEERSVPVSSRVSSKETWYATW